MTHKPERANLSDMTTPYDIEKAVAALRAIEDHRRLELSVRDSEAFVDAVLNPKPVNDRLRDTVRRYRRNVLTWPT